MRRFDKWYLILSETNWRKDLRVGGADWRKRMEKTNVAKNITENAAKAANISLTEKSRPIHDRDNGIFN